MTIHTPRLNFQNWPNATIRTTLNGWEPNLKIIHGSRSAIGEKTILL